MVDQAPNKKIYSLSAADKTLCVQSSSKPSSSKLNWGECSDDFVNPESDSEDKDGRFETYRAAGEEPSKEG